MDKTEAEILALPIERKFDLARILRNSGLWEDADRLLANKPLTSTGLAMVRAQTSNVIPLDAIRALVNRHKRKK
jgi:hypothetical protein